MKYKLSILSFIMCLTIKAQEEKSSLSNAASDATNPLAFVTKVQVQPNFTWKDNDGRQINLTSRVIQPSASIGLPFIKSNDPSKIYTIYRLEVPIIGQTFPGNPDGDATGLADLILLDAIVFKQKWGLLGAGPGLIFPTMKPEQISSRKWSAGAAVVVLNTKTKGLQWGFLAQQYFNFAGDKDRESKNFMIFQPILNKILGDGKFIQLGSILNFNWTDQTYHIPIAVNFGKAFSKSLSILGGPEYVVSGPNKGDFTIRFQINAMFATTTKK
ncbi:hypothetical protein RB619_20820 [Flavobacterium sp. LHD-80]|uniref:hypothetical protein n=1 Tax=Flavobacterium sp. LHD-80 TaxID=3071411 RepID=UPI0027E0F27F|nr:hypothetical protein [Flavobacterium sp. LHD-80]MDQ6473091.1 hypothetical protein [Flavobacterium sp. LHD-80]